MHNPTRIIRTTLLLSLAIGLIAGLAATQPVSAATTDHISGSVEGADGVTVTLLAWGARGPSNIVTTLPVARTATQAARFSFTVDRNLGLATTQQAGLSFRGWAVHLDGCTTMRYQPPAQPLASPCEAGWLIRPWEDAPLDSEGSVTFQLVSTPTILSTSSTPSPVPSSPPSYIYVTATLPSAPPAATHSVTPPTTTAPSPTAHTPLPTSTGIPTVTPPTPPSATSVPLIIEAQVRLEVTPRPTAAATSTPSLSATTLPVNTPAPAALPLSAPDRQSQTIIPLLELWQWLALGVVVIAILAATVWYFSIKERGENDEQVNS